MLVQLRFRCDENKYPTGRVVEQVCAFKLVVVTPPDIAQMLFVKSASRLASPWVSYLLFGSLPSKIFVFRRPCEFQGDTF